MGGFRQHRALPRILDTGSVDLGGVQAVIDNPRRIAGHGGWRVFAEDDDIRTAATELLHAVL